MAQLALAYSLIKNEAVTVNQDCFVGPVELLVLAGIEYRQQEHPPSPSGEKGF